LEQPLPAAAPPPVLPEAGEASPSRPQQAQTAPAPRKASSSGSVVERRSVAEEPPAAAVSAAAAPALKLTPSEQEEKLLQSAADKQSEQNDAAKQANVDRLLDEALAHPAEREARQEREQAMFADSALPPTPSREDVTQAMTVLLPAIRGCAMGQSGLATAGIVVRNDGKVASVSVAGAPFAGTPSGRCMEGVLRRARFPRFKQPTFRVKFPLAIQ
jgi:hypothetical protein